MLEYTSDTPHAFGAGIRELLINIAQSTELALAREQDRNRLELSRMNAVVSSGETMRALSTRQAVFEEAVAAVERRTQANFGALFWYHEDTDCLVLEAGLRSDGDRLGMLRGLRLPRGQALGWKVMTGGVTLHVADEEGLRELYQLRTARARPRLYRDAAARLGGPSTRGAGCL